MGVDTSQVDHLAADLAAAPAKVAGESVGAVARNARETQRHAQRFAAKLTGFMSEHIEVRAAGLTAEIVSTARYSDYQEYGTSVMAPHPFMRPAADLAAGPLADDLGDAGEDIL